MRPGQAVELKARALPFETFRRRWTGSPRPRRRRRGPTRTSTVTVYCRLERPDGDLRPGMTGYARVCCGERLRRRPSGRPRRSATSAPSSGGNRPADGSGRRPRGLGHRQRHGRYPPTPAGTAEPGSTVQGYDGAALRGAVTACPDGDMDGPPAAASTGHQLPVTATDPAGNSATSAILPVHVLGV